MPIEISDFCMFQMCDAMSAYSRYRTIHGCISRHIAQIVKPVTMASLPVLLRARRR